jgi:hypothetical protein
LVFDLPWSFDFLYNELVALKARVDKLESGRVVAADLVGTYSIHALGVELLAGSPAQIGEETTMGTVTLNADGTGVGVATDSRWDLRQGAPWSLFRTETPYPPNAFTWTVSNGKVVFPGNPDPQSALTIGAGGLVLIGGGTGPGPSGWSNIFILIRLPK